MTREKEIKTFDQESYENAIKYFDAIYNLSQTLGVSYSFIKDEIKEITKTFKLSKKLCNDAISRQDAIDALCKMLHDCFEADNEELDAVITTVNELPPVKPIEKVGHWIFVHPLQEDDGGGYMCSICNVGDWNLNGKENYCSNCGAKMEIEE